MPSEDREHELRSFGRRRGRKLSPRQSALMRDVLPRVAVNLTSPSPLQAELGSAKTWEWVGVRGQTPEIAVPSSGPSDHLLPRGEGVELWLEIGFGGGEHLLWQAKANPAVTIIGCEPFEDGVVKVLAKIADEKLDNICLHMGDARDVLRWLPDASIARAFILFPDPWPKTKHRKRRLVNPQTLDLLARVMKPGAELRFGTDIADYVRTGLLAITADSRFAWIAEGPKDWRIRPTDWPETRYEQKAQHEGRQRYYFRFRRKTSL